MKLYLPFLLQQLSSSKILKNKLEINSFLMKPLLYLLKQYSQMPQII